MAGRRTRADAEPPDSLGRESVDTREDELGRSTTRKELVEAEIIQHAVRLFAQRGFAGTNLGDIAAAAGLTRPALYHYFKSKDDLLERLVHQLTDDVADRLHAIVADETASPSVRLREMVLVLVRRQLADPARFQLMIRSEAELPGSLADTYLHGRRRVLDSFVAVIGRGVEAEEFHAANVRTAALGIIGTCNWTAWWYHPGNDAEEEIAQQLADFAVAGISVPGTDKTGEQGIRRVLARLRDDVARLEQAIDDQDSPV